VFSNPSDILCSTHQSYDILYSTFQSGSLLSTLFYSSSRCIHIQKVISKTTSGVESDSRYIGIILQMGQADVAECENGYDVSLVWAPVGVGGNCDSNHGHIDTDMGSCCLEKIEVLQ
jgi:hypothetical protein